MDLLWPVTHFIEQPYYWADVAGNWVFGWMVGWVVGWLLAVPFEINCVAFWGVVF